MADLYRFDGREVRPADRQLLIDGVPAVLGGRAFDLLVALIERRDRVVPKAELFDIVWPGLVVEENNLQVQVSSLRKVLGPNAIATVAGRGYRFVGHLEAPVPNALYVDGPAHPTNLPHARTRFIGRETALADCSALLDGTRLLTLSGIGGCGKTRLAQELAQRALGRFPDGVWFVDLAPLQEAQRVPALVAETLGVQVGQLVDHLKTRRALVVMDNCEHVIGAAARSIETLLESCGALKIIATSREVLGTAGEQVFAVRSLTLPASDALDDVRGCEAVRLFVDHARLVLPEFDVDQGNAAAIAEICRRLDGIALAIELAAARVRVLQLEDIRARIDDRFRLLTGGRRALPRHQTLQATMQWSHDLLTVPEQQLFRGLAVFAGGCTLAAAESVAGNHGDEYDVLERLTALHDKSLLVVDRDSRGEPRYRMLETVRQYAEERLNEAGESAEARTRHLRYYIALAEKAEREPGRRGQHGWFATFRHEQENLLAAHAWCAHAPDGGQLALRLVASSWCYWMYTAQPHRGYQLVQSALALAGGASENTEGCKTMLGMSRLAYAVGGYHHAFTWGQRALDMARRLCAASLTADGLRRVGSSLHATGDTASAVTFLTEAADVARGIGDQARLGAVLNALGEVHRASGNLFEAEALYREAARLARAGEDQRGTAAVLTNLGCVLMTRGELVEARAALAQARSLANVVGYKGLVECATDVAAALASSSGEHALAARFHGAAQRQLHEAGIRHEPADEAAIAPCIVRSRTALGDGPFERAKAEGWALSYEDAMSQLDRWLGVADQRR